MSEQQLIMVEKQQQKNVLLLHGITEKKVNSQ